MTLIVKEVVWDDFNIAHIGSTMLALTKWKMFVTEKSDAFLSHSGRFMVIDETKDGRIYQSCLAQKSKGVFYPVTARDASRKERRVERKMTKSIYQNLSLIQEEARFWDSHDMTDYFERNKKIVLDFSGVKKEREYFNCRLQPELKMRLGAVARRNGIQASTLARMWLVEKLRG